MTEKNKIKKMYNTKTDTITPPENTNVARKQNGGEKNPSRIFTHSTQKLQRRKDHTVDERY